MSLTCAEAPGQHGRTNARLVRDEEAAGSNPATRPRNRWSARCPAIMAGCSKASVVIETTPAEDARLPASLLKSIKRSQPFREQRTKTLLENWPAVGRMYLDLLARSAACR
jgi:hypothetical protein